MISTPSNTLNFYGLTLQYMTDGVLLRETLKDSDLDKYRYGDTENFSLLDLHLIPFVE